MDIYEEPWVMKIFSYSNREEAKKYIGYPCLFSDSEQMNPCDAVPGLLRNVVDSELPFVYYEATHVFKYLMPIDVDALYKIEDLACWIDIEQILAAAIYVKHKEVCK